MPLKIFDETEVDHKSTPAEIAEFAIKKDHRILYDCWSLYRDSRNKKINPLIRWREVMQSAAISLSIQLKEAQKELTEYHMRYGALKNKGLLKSNDQQKED